MIGLLFFSVALLFSTKLQVHFTLPKLAALRICTFFLVVMWIYRFKKGEFKPIPKTIFYSVMLLAIWWSFTTIFAIHKSTALDGFYGRYNGLWTHEIFLLLFFITASIKADMERIERIVKLFIIVLIPVSLYAVLQYYDIDLFAWPKTRPASTIGHPVTLAALLGIALPFILSFFLSKSRNNIRLYWGILLSIFLFVIILTLSRGPWIGAFVSSLIVLIESLKDDRIKFKKAITIAFLFCILIAIFLALKHDGLTEVVERLKTVGGLKSDVSIKGKVSIPNGCTQYDKRSSNSRNWI